MNKRRRTTILSGLLVLVGGASHLAYVVRQRKDPSVCPYGLRFSLAHHAPSSPARGCARSSLPSPARGCSRSDLVAATTASMPLGG